MKDNIIAIKSVEFGERTVKAYQFLLEKDETNWIDLLHHGHYLTDAMSESLQKDVRELISLLVAIIKSSKGIE